MARDLFPVIAGRELLPEVIRPREPLVALRLANLVDTRPGSKRPVPLSVQSVFVERHLSGDLLVDGEVRCTLIPSDAVVVLEEGKSRRTRDADDGEGLVFLRVLESPSNESFS